MSKRRILRKLIRINKEIGNTEIGKDGRYRQLDEEKNRLENAFYQERKK